jgi:glycosyltransferase involved in cell wall biosynthesis
VWTCPQAVLVVTSDPGLAPVRNRRILYIVRRLPHPLNSGTRIRQFELLTAYAQIAEVVLVCFYTDEEELAGTSALAPYCAEIHPVSFRSRRRMSRDSKLPAWWEKLRRSASPKPFLAKHCFSPEMKRLVEQIAPSSDLIHVGRLNMIPHVESLLDNVPTSPKRWRDGVPIGHRFVLDLDDIETVLKSRELRIAPPVRWHRRAYEYFDLCRLWLYQRRALGSFDRILVCSEKDRRLFARNAAVTVVPNGVSLPPRILPEGSDGRTLLCLGTYGHWPNVDGLRFFVDRIFPLIRQEVSGARLVVVGRDTPPEVYALHDGKTICVEGTVPSVEEYYRQATVAIVPLRIAAGTRLKILEAFGLGRPVVSTSVGCEGLEVTNGEHLLVADEPRGFANACIDLLKNGQLRERLVHNARGLVERHYTWDSIHQRVHDVARELLEEC